MKRSNHLLNFLLMLLFCCSFIACIGDINGQNNGLTNISETASISISTYTPYVTSKSQTPERFKMTVTGAATISAKTETPQFIESTAANSETISTITPTLYDDELMSNLLSENQKQGNVMKFWGNDDANYVKTIAITFEDSQLGFFKPKTILDRLMLFPDETPRIVQHILDNCDLIVLMQTSDGWQLARIDAYGKMLGVIYDLPIDYEQESIKVHPAISVPYQYVSYAVFSGERYYDTADFQDVEIVRLDQVDPPIRLTKRGGASNVGGAWSPDGSIIAYTDYDERGYLQVYQTNLEDLTQKQLTDSQEEINQPGPIFWSPTGEALAVIVNNAFENDEVWIVSSKNGEVKKLNVPPVIITLVRSIYWSEDGKMLLLQVGDDNSQISGLYWFDVVSNQMIYWLSENLAEQHTQDFTSFAFTFPLTTDLSQVVFYNSGWKWHVFDVRNNTIKELPWLSAANGTHLYVTTFQEDYTNCHE